MTDLSIISWLLAAMLSVLAAAAVPLTSARESSGRPARSVNEGVYTAAQALRGEGLFGDHCESCHEPERFAGRLFVATWAGPLDALFTTVRKSMPEDNPGGLSPQAYADVIAYWLRLNGYPAGAERLDGTIDAMRNVELEPPRAAEPEAPPAAVRGVSRAITPAVDRGRSRFPPDR